MGGFLTLNLGGNAPVHANSPYLYLRVIDLNDDNDINYSSLKRIDKSLYEALKRYEIRDNEIAFSIAGSIGKVMLVHDIPERYHLILTENCAKLIIKENHTLLPQYLSILLNLPIVQKQVRLNYVQTTIPKLSLERIGRLMIPPIPSIKRQKNVIRRYYNALENKQIKENQAKQILDNIDNYVLGELGISMLNTHSSSLTDRIFSINFKDLDQKRLDSNYFDKKYSKLIDCIKNGKYPLVPLKDITSFISTGLTPKAGHYSDIKTNFPIIKAGSYNGYEADLTKVAYTSIKQPYSVKKGDIFILSAAHQAEYIAKNVFFMKESPLVNTSYVGELLCVRGNKSVNSMYIYSVLSTSLYKTLLNREKRGQTSHLYAHDIRHILIPLPPISIQNIIADKVENFYLKAKIMLREGETELKKAQCEVERMIMN